jgi:hypothetical protein
VNRFRAFSSGQSGDGSGAREVQDAPGPMRQELVDLFYSIAEHNHEEIQPEHVYQATSQSLGIQVSNVAYGGYRQITSRDVGRVDWPRIYDLIARLFPDFERQGFGRAYQEGVNKILAAYSTAWELDDQGRLYRILPGAALNQVTAAFAELQQERFAPALALYNAGRNAYDDRPRRDRDACSNMFDAMESVAKEKYQMPDATFGHVVTRIYSTETMSPPIANVLSALNDLRNKTFGHGMTTPFKLSSAEVDFTYLSCVGGILLLTRMR